MADIVDEASKIEAAHLARALLAARAPVAEGEPGECDECGEESPRLVVGRCAPCRDRQARLRRRLGGYA